VFNTTFYVRVIIYTGGMIRTKNITYRRLLSSQSLPSSALLEFEETSAKIASSIMSVQLELEVCAKTCMKL
jgi:hypothetical protein